MSRTLLPTLGFVALASLFFAVDRADSAPPAAPGPFTIADVGLEVRAWPTTTGKAFDVEQLANGNWKATEKTSVTLDALGTRELTGVVEDQPVAKGGQLKATITDDHAKQTMSFTYAPAANSLTFTQGADSVTIVQNPDHTYQVNGKAAANGKAAVALLKAHPAYTRASPHSVLLAYSYAQQPSLETRQPICCINCDGGGPSATPPAVCATFKDVCDCIACDKAGKMGACNRCK